MGFSTLNRIKQQQQKQYEMKKKKKLQIIIHKYQLHILVQYIDASINNRFSLNFHVIIVFGSFADAEELSSRLMHTIIDIRNDENGRVILEEARKDQIVNPLDLRCVYLEQILGEYWIG